MIIADKKNYHKMNCNKIGIAMDGSALKNEDKILEWILKEVNDELHTINHEYFN